MDGIKELIPTGTQVWSLVKKVFASSLAVGCLIVGIAVGRGCSPKEVIVVHEGKVVRDSTDAIRAEESIAREVKTAQENATLLARLKNFTGITSTPQASGTVGGRAETKIQYVEVPVAGDTVKSNYVADYDFPIAGMAKDGLLEFVTVNLYREVSGEPSRKHYEFPLRRGNMAFMINSNPDPEALNGIQLVYQKRFVYWDGMFIGGGYTLPGKYFLSLEPRLVFYEDLEFSIGLRSTPSLEAQLRYRW